MGTRRALIFATAGRYLTLMLQIATSFIVAHHVLPDEFGLTVLGSGVLMVATALRDMGTTGYLVRDEKLDPYKVRSSFTLSFVVTLLLTVLLIINASVIARFYGDGRLIQFLYLVAAAYALGPFVNPIIAMLSRDMAFQRTALIDVGSATAGAVVTISLAISGVGFLSVGWGLISRAAVAAVLSLAIKHELWLFKPSIREWRSVLTFGIHGSATAMIYTCGEAIIYLLLGKLIDARAVGLMQRAYLLTQTPERVLLAGVGAVAVPTFGKLARNGEPLVEPYILGLRLVAPVYFMSMLGLIALADPLVSVLLGPSWEQVVWLLRIIATGHLVGLGIVLNGGVLVGVGGIKRTAPLALFQILIMMLAIVVAAPFGLLTVACTFFVTLPIITFASYCAVRKWVPFAWRDVSLAGFEGLLPAVVGILPVVLLMLTRLQDTRPLVVLVIGTVIGGVTWLAALKVIRHPLFNEIDRLGRRLILKSAPRSQM